MDILIINEHNMEHSTLYLCLSLSQVYASLLCHPILSISRVAFTPSYYSYISVRSKRVSHSTKCKTPIDVQTHASLYTSGRMARRMAPCGVRFE